MNKKGIEDKFSKNIDAYLNSIQNVDGSNNEEFNELLEIGKTLASRDFSETSNKEAVFNKTLKTINEYKGDNVMKKSNKIKKTVAAAAVFLMVGSVFTQTSFAKGLAVRVINQLSLGHISAVQTEESGSSKVTIPDNLKGKIFDKNKKPVTVFSKDTGSIYTASGEQIESFAGGKIVTVAEYKKTMDKNKLTVRDVNSLNKYTCFNVKLPSFLPEGYKFDRAVFYKDESGIIGKDNKSEIIQLYFTNNKTGKEIFIDERVDNKQNKYEEASDEKIQKVKVNGADAILIGNESVNWEANGMLYGIIGKDIGKDGVIKIAQSIK